MQIVQIQILGETTMTVAKKSMISNSTSKKPAKKLNPKAAVIAAAKLKTAVNLGGIG
jgi:hypothetical protein